MTPPDDPRRLRLWLVCLGLFFGTLLLFSRGIPHEFIDLDDPDYVSQNTHVQMGLTWTTARWAFVSGEICNWHPLTWLSHLLDWQLFGSNPHGHHATNVIWHSLNAVLAFLALWRLTGAFWTSAASAALFAWHPLRVESVAWVSERKDVLSGFFALATLWAYAEYARGQRLFQTSPRSQDALPASIPAGHRAACYTLALALFALGLMSKPMLVSLPFVLLLLDYWPLRRFRRDAPQSLWLLLREKLPFLLLAAASSLATYLVQQKGGAVTDTFTLSERMGNALISICRYLGSFFWPFSLALGYSLPAHWPLLTVAAAMALLLLLSGLAWWQRRRRPWLLVGWLWFLVMLAPVLGVVQVGLQAMADRYTYLPVLGVGIALFWTLREWRTVAPLRWLKPAAVALLLAGGTARTWDQLAVWQNSHTLHEHTLAVTRDNYLGQSYLATTFFNEKRFIEAAAHFRRAVELKPDFLAARYRLGVSLENLGRADEAMAAFMELLRIHPSYGIAHYSVGGLLLQRNQPAEAIPHFEAALKIKPDYDPAHLAMGVALTKLNRPQEALVCYEKALTFNPRNAVAWFDSANLLLDLHREQEALERYEKALRLDPNFEEAHCNYANALRAANRPQEACVHYRQALSLEPKDASAHYGLGAALEDLGETDKPLACYLEAIRLQPEYAEAHYSVGAILLSRNQPAEAILHFKKTVESQTNHASACLGLGLAAAQLNRLREAVGYYQQALAFEPDNPITLCCLGGALRRQGNPAEAVSYYEKALRLKPDYAEAHAELGNVLYRLNRPAQAIPHLEQALQLHPGFKAVEELLTQARHDVQSTSSAGTTE